MMDEDIEVLSNIEDGDGIAIVGTESPMRKAMRWQNRCFAFAMATLLSASAVYLGRELYLGTPSTDLPVGQGDAPGGSIGNDASSPKIQEALDKSHHKPKPGHAASTWWEQHHDPFSADGGNTYPVEWNNTDFDFPHGVHSTHQHGDSSSDTAKNKTKKGGYGKSKGNHHGQPRNHTSKSTSQEPEGTSSIDVTSKSPSAPGTNSAVWLASNVSLQSGVKFKVVGKLPHDTSSFTEGLTFTLQKGTNGTLYESTGMYGNSLVKILNPDTGALLSSVKLEQAYFGEGMVYVDGKLVQLSWREKTGFVYNASNITLPPKTFTFSTTKNEGWGITYDKNRKELIVSDGSSYLHFWDPTTFKQKRKVKVVRLGGSAARNINELEFWRGRVLANVWYEDTILVIHPKTGVVEKEYDFSTLFPNKNPEADVLNGISVSKDPNVLYITGKQWSWIFRVKLLP